MTEIEHRDDGRCHEECWQRAVAEFEAGQAARRASDLSAYRDVAGFERTKRQRTKDETITRARELRADGESLYSIASTLGVTKEWLREYAGLS